MKLTKEQRKDLQAILADKYAFGAVSGQMDNMLLEYPLKTREELLLMKLETRQFLREAGKEDFSQVPDL